MNLVIENLQNLFITSLEKILKDLEEADIDQILDNRDLHVFSDAWTSAYKEIKIKPVTIEEQEQIDVVRKDIFMRVFSKSESSDLSAYISDDFELICFHLLGSDKNTWVTALCAEYFNNQIPQGELVSQTKTLKEMFEEIARTGKK